MTLRVPQALALVLWGLVIALVGALVGGGETLGQSSNRAALVVAFNGGQTETSCVEFDKESITGAELLRRSGLSVVFSSFGGLGSGVCKIDGTGCSDPGDCFCQCRGPDCAFWQYYSLEDGAWQFQNLGASSRDVEHGDMDAWVWGDGERPPNVSFSSVCPLPRTPTQRPAPTATPRPPTQEPRGEGPRATRPEPAPPTQAPRAQQPRIETGEPAPRPAATSTTETPRATPTRAATESPTADIRRDASTPQRDVRGAVEPDAEDGGGGVPVGLIAFGAVAGALAAAAGGLLVRSRLRGW